MTEKIPNCGFDTVIKAICPHCHKNMGICSESKTYCQSCDFSYNGENPCENCSQNVPGYSICKTGGFKK